MQYVNCVRSAHLFRDYFYVRVRCTLFVYALGGRFFVAVCFSWMAHNMNSLLAWKVMYAFCFKGAFLNLSFLGSPHFGALQRYQCFDDGAVDNVTNVTKLANVLRRLCC